MRLGKVRGRVGVEGEEAGKAEVEKEGDELGRGTRRCCKPPSRRW